MQSIWFVLDDKSNYTSQSWYNNPVSNVDEAAKKVYDAIHHPTDGALANGVTKYEFFRSYYDYHRRYVLYRYFKKDVTTFCSNPAYWDNDQDLNGYVDNGTLTTDDDFRLIYPEPVMYKDLFDNNDSPTNYGSPTTFNATIGSTPLEIFNRTFIQNACVQTTAEWMIQLNLSLIHI